MLNMTQRQKILIVDDDSISMNVNLMLLKEVDADISTVASGKEAIQKTTDENFDLILMDVMMPGIDGFEAIELIRRDTKNKFVPVLFISALPGDELRTIKGLEAGAIDFIIKPVSKEILQIKVKNLLVLQKYKAALEETHRELRKAVEEIQLLREEEAVRAKKGYEIVVRTSMDAFALIDTKGRILEVNTIYCEMTGYSHDEHPCLELTVGAVSLCNGLQPSSLYSCWAHKKSPSSLT